MNKEFLLGIYIFKYLLINSYIIPLLDGLDIKMHKMSQDN